VTAVSARARVKGIWHGLVRRLARTAVASAEAEAQLARDRLRDAIEAIPEGVVFLDAEGRYVLWNRRYAEIYHRSADLFRPGARLIDTLREGVRRGDYPDAAGAEEAWLAEREAKLLDAAGRRHEQRLADGRWLMIEERRTSDGGIIGLRVDITELKRQAAALEQALAHAEAANRAKSEFLADMSHELRTPLNGVSGLVRALEGAGLDDHQRALAADIRASADQLEQLVLGLLDYGDADLAPEPAAATRLAPAEGQLGTGPLRVLVADDNPTNRKVIELMLASAGVRTVSVEDGRAAIREIRAEEARSLRPPTPVVVLSANTAPPDRQATTAAGADRHIGKPIRAEELFAAIEAALASRADQSPVTGTGAGSGPPTQR
jgi:CheY-like chemotaxis protein